MDQDPIKIEPQNDRQRFFQKAHIVVHVKLVAGQGEKPTAQLSRLRRVASSFQNGVHVRQRERAHPCAFHTFQALGTNSHTPHKLKRKPMQQQRERRGQHTSNRQRERFEQLQQAHFERAE